MKLRQFVFVSTLLTAAVVSGSGVEPDGPGFVPGPAAPGRGAVDRPPVIDLHGLHTIEFGDTEQELTRRGVLQPQADACGLGLAGHEAVSPIFAGDRLVLLWVSPPVRTPEGVTDGTPVSKVRASYPTVSRLTAPKGTYRLDGLLARRGDRAYLFLHDGRTVRKTIAGYADHARAFFEAGRPPC
jgi:hypothetical protein